MNAAYQLTHHAAIRIEQRQLRSEDLCAALAGRSRLLYACVVLIYDPRSRCAIVADTQAMTILTAFRLKKKQVKRYCSR